jgi:hypothetical protein
MQNLTLSAAFSMHGALANPPRSAPSAIASDSALVMLCSAEHFVRHTEGVLRYDDRLSRAGVGSSASATQLAQHLATARDGALAVRLIVQGGRRDAPARGGRPLHVRRDLVGRVIEFDGDRFVVDFTKSVADAADDVEPPKRKVRRRR